MKAVLISTQPKWCELIASGKKTIEVRKSKPTLEMPFKCYIYETQDKQYEKSRVVFSNGRGFAHATGKVIGEFVCDEIDDYIYETEWDICVDIDDDTLPLTMLTRKEIIEYAHGKTLYGWHISELKIYDKPKELSEFKRPCDRFLDCFLCRRYKRDEFGGCDSKIHRPPQSWCYVEEI